MREYEWYVIMSMMVKMLDTAEARDGQVRARSSGG